MTTHREISTPTLPGTGKISIFITFPLSYAVHTHGHSQNGPCGYSRECSPMFQHVFLTSCTIQTTFWQYIPLVYELTPGCLRSAPRSFRCGFMIRRSVRWHWRFWMTSAAPLCLRAQPIERRCRHTFGPTTDQLALGADSNNRRLDIKSLSYQNIYSWLIFIKIFRFMTPGSDCHNWNSRKSTGVVIGDGTRHIVSCTWHYHKELH